MHHLQWNHANRAALRICQKRCFHSMEEFGTKANAAWDYKLYSRFPLNFCVEIWVVLPPLSHVKNCNPIEDFLGGGKENNARDTTWKEGHLCPCRIHPIYIKWKSGPKLLKLSVWIIHFSETGFTEFEKYKVCNWDEIVELLLWLKFTRKVLFLFGLTD